MSFSIGKAVDFFSGKCYDSKTCRRLWTLCVFFKKGRERVNSNITVICGHYGCGKTNLALNLAVEAAAKGRRSVIVDMDIVNPYFRSSEYGPFLEKHGVQLIAPVFANTTLDTPVLPPEIYSIFNMEDTDVFIDAGGDDVGATALGRLSRELTQAGYEMIYVVNRYRILSTKPEETLPLLREIEGASHLRATAVVNNSHLGVDTTLQTVRDAVDFAEESARLCGLPLLYSTIPDFAAGEEIPEGFKVVRRYVHFVWEDEADY